MLKSSNGTKLNPRDVARLVTQFEDDPPDSDDPAPYFLLVFGTFTVLKLTGDLDWGWEWITAPIWTYVGLKLIGAFK